MVKQNIAPSRPAAAPAPKQTGDTVLQSLIGYIKGLINDVKGIKEQDIPYLNERITILENNMQQLAEGLNLQRYYIEQMHRYHVSLKQVTASLDAMSTEYLNLTMPQQQEGVYPEEEYPVEQSQEMEEISPQEPMTLEDIEAQILGAPAHEEPVPQPTVQPVIQPAPQPLQKPVPVETPKEEKPKKEPKIKAKTAADILRSLEEAIPKE
jgi:hypothetical protein